MTPESHPRFNVDFQSSAFRPTDQGMGVIAEGGSTFPFFWGGKYATPKKNTCWKVWIDIGKWKKRIWRGCSYQKVIMILDEFNNLDWCQN